MNASKKLCKINVSGATAQLEHINNTTESYLTKIDQSMS